ncbi:ABC transporter ATP-binding protein [Caldibacillus lycopersici]|uniref:ABC transporter ATP-binding protein n=1 Tax=Perspicuibacillus lycopersici TaxID=1325689 RepID=A0AAE3IQN1_9BACI|nr:ABC transporter ATP-binding protein [Perspicuibacillus lycopersici]MCU9612631.1 ABC transporter ATP-binding protein [Perspicuibacillus lycopersici]
MIEIKNISKRYGNHLALDDISLTINDGEITGFLGTNGAGKSTLMNIITGYISMTEGTILIDGIDSLEDPEKVKKKIGYLPELPPLYMDMTVAEYLKFVCKLKHIPVKQIPLEMEKKMAQVKIEHVRNRLIKNLSKGYKQRVGLAQAILGNPSLLILDEPTVGLDPREIIEVRKLIQEISKNCTIIISSHILSEISTICSKVMILDKGRHIVTAAPNELIEKMNNTTQLHIRVKGDEDAIQKALHKLEGITHIKKLGNYEEHTVDLLIVSEHGIDIREVLSVYLVTNHFPIIMMKNYDVSLEDIFLQLTSSERGE